MKQFKQSILVQLAEPSREGRAGGWDEVQVSIYMELDVASCDWTKFS